MYKNKILISLLTGLLVLGQATPIFATSTISDDLSEHQDTSNNHADWDNIEYGGAEDDSYLSPDYYPEDHEIYGGFPGTRDEGNGTGGKGNNSGSNGNGGNGNGGPNGTGGNGNGGTNGAGGYDEVLQTSKYKIKDNTCYLTTSTVNGGKEKVTENKVDMYLCLGAGGTVGENGNGSNSVGNIDLSKLVIYPSAPGEGANVQDVADVIGESDAKEAESSSTYEIVYDKDGNIIGVVNKDNGKEYKVGEKITLSNGVVIGVVGPDGTIDSSANEYLQGEGSDSVNGSGSNGKTSNINNDFDGLGKDTHGLYYSLDKSRGDSSLIYLDIKVKEDKTITNEEFISALTTVANANNGKVIKDEGRTLFFLEGKLMMTLNPTENVNVDMFAKLFNGYDSGIFVKPVKK